MQASKGSVLVLNAGSSSIKFALFDDDLEEQLTGLAADIGGQSYLKIAGQHQNAQLTDHSAALAAVLASLEARGVEIRSLRAAAHRVVHGGSKLTAPQRITPTVRNEIAACASLAPLHNPHNLAAIDTLSALAPDLPQFASFDTSFHASNPEVAQRYALPQEIEAKGIRRYGFHGISYASLVSALPHISGQPLPKRLLALHLGNGASICAIENGKSVATTMGYSPLEGLTMGTRSGSIDANAVLRLASELGIEQAGKLLNNTSGLLGLSGQTSDMRALSQSNSVKSQFAIEHFCYWALRHAGSLIAAMEGLDAIAFTGGIGENDSKVRSRIAKGLSWLGLALDQDANARNAPKLHTDSSAVKAYVVPAQEERQIAADALSHYASK